MAGMTFEEWLKTQEVHAPLYEEVEWARSAWEAKEKDCAAHGCMMCQELSKPRGEMIKGKEVNSNA
jgi:hypothetical protein